MTRTVFIMPPYLRVDSSNERLFKVDHTANVHGTRGNDFILMAKDTLTTSINVPVGRILPSMLMSLDSIYHCDELMLFE